MADRATAERWLHELCNTPTIPGYEDRVVEWVERWVSRRPDLTSKRDSGGNVLITRKGRKRLPLVLAVAHIDHPGFLITGVEGRRIDFEFRGGVDAPYFDDASMVFHPPHSGTARILSYDPKTQEGTAETTRGGASPGAIAEWRFGGPRRSSTTLFRAPACDDLAGAAASLAALDALRKRPELNHFGVLLTRAEEVGLVGALHAAKHQTIPVDTRLLSIETSRALPAAPIGDGPIIRVGDRATIFDQEMSNRISYAAARSGMKHQRKLMDGGGCEATAFGGYGYRSTGLCVALGNWHNRGNLDAVEQGTGEAVPMLEEISLEDFHGLVKLIALAAEAVDQPDNISERLDRLYEDEKHVLG